MPIPVPSGSPVTDLVNIDDVAAHLNWSEAQATKYEAEMSGFITAVTPIIEDIVGPVVIRAFDQWYSGGRSMIALDYSPVVAVQTVTESMAGLLSFTLTAQPLDGSTFDAYGYTVDLASALLVRRVMGATGVFAPGLRNIHVVYTAGQCVDTSSVPKNVRLAALELIRVNWQPQQGGNRPQMNDDALASTGGAPMGFFVPNRVYELLRPTAAARGFGIA